MITKINIATLRQTYNLNKLKRKSLPSNPINLFKKWLFEAVKLNLLDPNAMSLSTVSENGQPYQRIVLLKYFHDKEMIFFSNFNSRKAMHLEKNSQASLLFYWKELQRQVMVLGNIKKTSNAITKKYFYSRPKNSQISSLISKQSKKINSRSIIEKKFIKMKKIFNNEKKIPLPIFWGGYKLKISVMEFWQGREDRLHDRFFYQYNKIIKKWDVNRLYP